MARGNAKARAVLKYPENWYTPVALHDWPERDLRLEYTRLRDIMHKRLVRIGQDPELRETEEYRYLAKHLPRLRDISDRQELQRALANVAWFIRNPEISTVAGVKERTARYREMAKETMGDVDEAYFGQLGDWFDYCREQGLDEIYSSDEIVEYFYTVPDRKYLNKQDFIAWTEGQNAWAREAAQGPEPDSSSEELDSSLEKLSKGLKEL